MLDKEKERNILKIINKASEYRSLVMKYEKITEEEAMYLKRIV